MAKPSQFDKQEAMKLASDNNTGGEVLHNIAEQHSNDKNIMKKVVSHPKAQGKTLDLAYNAGYEDALDHENVPAKTVDHAFNQITALNPKDINYDHIDRALHEKVNPKKKDAYVAKLMDHPDLNSSTWGQNIVSRYYSKGQASDDMMNKAINHPDKHIVNDAIKSPKFTEEHLDTLLGRKDIGRDTLREVAENESLSPDAIRKLHAASKKIKPNLIEHHYNSVDKQIAEHPNTPPDVLDKYSNKKNDYRSEALSNKNFPIDKLIELHRNQDSDAERALINRADTPEEILREIDTKYPTVDKYDNRAKQLIRHPNYPEDLMLKRAKGGTDSARAVLGRQAFDMPQSVLKVLVNHKNTNVALDALRHSNITPEVVLEAYNRKAHDVAAAAGSHPLLPKEMQAARAVENKDAALNLAAQSSDPSILKAIAQQWGADENIQRKLMSNKSTDSDTLHDIITRSASEHEEHHWNHPIKQLDDHPNMSAQTRQFLLNHPEHYMKGFEHSGLTPSEARSSLEYRSREDRANMRNTLGTILTHPNMDKETIKDVVSGKYGVPDAHSGLGQYAKENPNLYDKDILETAINTPAELTSSRVVGDIVRNSDFLTSDDIHNQISKAMANRPGVSQYQEKHDRKVAQAMLENPNIDPKILTDFVSDAFRRPTEDADLIESALSNESYPKNHLKELYTHRLFKPSDDASNLPEILGNYMKENATPEEKYEALKTTHNPSFASKLLTERFGDLVGPSYMRAALENPNPEVAVKALDFMSDRHHRAMNDSRYRELIDSLTEHPHEEVRSAAFPLMSPEAQAKMTAGQDILSNPDLIPGLKIAALEQQKIQPHHNAETINRVLYHPGLRWEHVSQIVNHSPEAARQAVQALNNLKFSEDTGKISREDAAHLGHVHHQIMDKYSDNRPLLDEIASESPDSSVIDRFLNDPKLMSEHSDAIIDNPRTKADQLDKFLKLKGPSHSGLFHKILENNKISRRMLEHIAANYPEYLSEVANHPKAYSPKVLKHLISSGDNRIIAAALNNPKTPDEIRETFKNNPDILLRLNKDHVQPSDLMKIADTGDVELQNKILDHPSTDGEVLGQLAHAAVDKIQDPATKKEQLRNISGDLDHELTSDVQNLILQNGDAKSFSNVLDNRHNDVSSKNILESLDKFKNDANYKALVASAVYSVRRHDSKSNENTEVINKLIDSIDNVGDEYPSSYRAKSNHIGSDLIEQLIDSPARNAFTPEMYDKVLNKLETDRGEGYRNNAIGRINLISDQQLLRSLALSGPASLLSKLAEYPELHKLISEERKDNLDRDTYAKMVNNIGSLLKLHKTDRDWYGVVSHMDRLMNSPLATKQDFDNIYQAGMKSLDENDKSKFVERAAMSPNLPDHILNQMVKERNPTSVLSNPRIDKDKIKSLMHEALSANEMLEVARNPNAELKDFNDMMKSGGHSPAIFAASYAALLKRPQSAEDLATTYEMLPRHSQLAKQIALNPGVSEETLRKMHEAGDITTDILESTPHLGGKIWRSKRHAIPQRIPGISPSDTPETNAQIVKPRIEKLQNVANMIPEGGYIEWANFKKDNPSLAGDPLVQKMFTSASKQRLTKEHADQYLSKVPGKEFNISYQKWTGMQRHNPVPQLVINVNNGPFMDEHMAKDPKAATVYHLIQQASKNSGHPITPQSIGWARVDTSDDNHWFIDEIQSDFNSNISGQLSELQKNPSHAQQFADKYGMTVDEAKKVMYKVTDIMQGWEKALVEHVMTLAKKKGVKKVSMHSGESKTRVNKGKDREVTNKYDKLYNKLPQDLGFKSSWYKDIPTAHDKNLNDHKIWTYDLPEQTKKNELTDESLAKISGLIESIKKADMKSMSPESFQAAMETLQALIRTLSAHTSSMGSELPPENKEDGKQDSSPHIGKDKPITHHHHEIYAPGSVRTDPNGQTREKMASGEWTHISREGEH